MAEKSTTVDVVRVDYVCDKCGEGKLQFLDLGAMLLVHPPRYPHACPNCGERQSFQHVYPRIEYRDKD